jgi:hypothetical protein
MVGLVGTQLALVKSRACLMPESHDSEAWAYKIGVDGPVTRSVPLHFRGISGSLESHHSQWLLRDVRVKPQPVSPETRFGSDSLGEWAVCVFGCSRDGDQGLTDTKTQKAESRPRQANVKRLSKVVRPCALDSRGFPRVGQA